MADCVYKTVSLEANEVFTLPPGATLIGVSDVSQITSTCEIPPLETPLCYLLSWAISDNIGNDTPALADFEYSLDFYMGSTAYNIVSFGSGAHPNNPSAFNSVIPPGLITISDMHEEQPANSRAAFLMHFSAIPSIAAQIRLMLFAPSFDSGGTWIYPIQEECPG